MAVDIERNAREETRGRTKGYIKEGEAEIKCLLLL